MLSMFMGFTLSIFVQGMRYRRVNVFHLSGGRQLISKTVSANLIRNLLRNTQNDNLIS